MKSTRNISKLAIAAILILTVAGASRAGVIYVDDDAAGANNGSNWTDAYKYLQDALAAAVVAEKPVEILVAQGTYKPDQGGGKTAGDQTATFQLINGVAIKGGYAGTGASDPDAHDISVYVVTLSGDLNNDDALVSDPTDLLTEPTRADNTYVITTGTGTDSTAVLDGCVIIGANNLGGSSCGIENMPGSPSISNCTFTYNKVGMWNVNGSNPNVSDCKFIRNLDSGMINTTNCSPQVINCTFDTNKGKSVNPSNYSNGGGMNNQMGCSPIITNCTFINNSTEVRGGALFNWSDCSPIVTNCVFRNNNNTSSNTNCRGGAVHNEGGRPIFTNCTFEKNISTYGGGGVWSTGCENVTFDNCTFTENTAVHSGGGMDIGDGTATLKNCTFNLNSADIAGGLHNFRNVKLTMNNCTFNDNSARMGGGLYNNYGINTTTTITDCTFSGNTAGSGAGMYSSFNSSPFLNTCTFTANSANSNGGGMCNFDNCNPYLINCTFNNNKAPWGAGIDNGLSCSPTLTNCSFEGNIATSAGGGMSNYDRCSPTVNDCTFTSNSANSGAGIYSYRGSPTINNCSFESNSSGDHGGAICNNSSDITVTNCIFRLNSAKYGGGVSNIDWSNESNPALVNCIFSENLSTYGGALSHISGTQFVINCTLFQNSAPSGNAVWNDYGSTPILVNCILWNGGNEIVDKPGCTTNVSYSDVQEGWTGAGGYNIDADPKFAGIGDFHLTPESPCINAGGNSAVPAWVTTDLDGNPRILGLAVDMGAYELDYDNDPPVTTILLSGTPGNTPWYVSDVEVTLTATDDDSGVLFTIYSLDGINWFDYTGPFTITNEGETTIQYGSQDNAGNIEILQSTTVYIDKTAPEITVNCPASSEPYQLGTALDFTVSDSVSGLLEHSATLIDTSGYSGQVTTGFVPEVGVYTFFVGATDVAGNTSESQHLLIAIYDPTGGFVTGGGWIYSAPGSFVANPDAEGKANFGFVSKYKKGASIPTGNTEFVFKAGDLNFHSSSYDWLVVTGSNYARFKGTGTINGSGEYNFMLWAGDGPDTFRIRIWLEDELANEYDIYDNGTDQGILGGNIIVHAGN